MITDFAIYFQNAIDIIFNADMGMLFSMFWHFIIFELPRYFLAIIAVAICHVFSLDNEGEHTQDVTRKTVSLLLPGHNEASALRQTILSMQEQTVKPNQIIVVSDGSTDGMEKEADKLKKEGLIDIVLSTDIRCGKSAAANLGLGYCTGELVIITDVDTSFDRDAFEKIIQPFGDSSIGAVAGNLGARNWHKNVVTAYQSIQYLTSISLGRRVSDMLGILAIVSGAFAAFRIEVLNEIGGWEVGPGEDADLTIKIRRSGWKIKFAPDSWCLTDVPESLFALIRQRLRWNRSTIRIRMRKFAVVFNPFHKSFSLLDAISSFDTLFFQFGLALSFLIYLIWIFYFFGGGAFIIFLITTALYLVMGVF